MKKLLISSLLLPLCGALYAAINAQHDPIVNAVNRLPMHTAFFAYESPEKAVEGNRNSSGRFLSLNGPWKFLWVRDAWDRPEYFFRTDFDDRSWGTIPVPGMWQLNGYGDPQYVNHGYPWREQFKSDPPHYPDAGNHVGSYRRTVEIPEAWNGQQIVAHFGSVTSNISLWVNGRYVGYSEDSKLETEFDLTPYVKPGTNLIAFQVFRWCDGTYLEDQDFFRLSGVARDCYLYARDKRHIADLQVTPILNDDYTMGRLDIRVEVSRPGKGCTLNLNLSDAAGRPVGSEQAKITASTQRFTLDAGKIDLWSAETPVLYRLTATLHAPSGEVIEVIPLRTGFREVKIAGGQLLVNGRPILIKGANRHEIDPDGGYIVSEERMLQDIHILKENNFNAVRTCHYPDDVRWYELCDEYGLYVVAEANIESHGMGYGENPLAEDSVWKQAHLERNERNVRRNFNYPSVIIWSLGNESGDGANFTACYDWIKAYDPSRPVQFEQAFWGKDRNTDIICPMYWDYNKCERYASGNLEKPLIQCEYAHAMGNSMGGFKEYWELIRKYPFYQGGFIWDFVDQSLRKQGKNGKMIYGYGGDWNPYDASDKNFCDNGLVSPDRIPNPHMHEVRYWQQPVWVREVDLQSGRIAVFNEYAFRNLSAYSLNWRLLCDGQEVLYGNIPVLNVAPQSEELLQLDYDSSRLPVRGELLLDVAFQLRRAEAPLPAGHIIARQQFVVRERKVEAPGIASRYLDNYTSNGTIHLAQEDRNFMIVEGENVRLDFDRKSGFMTRYEVGGVAYLQPGAMLKPNFWRAPTDNDFGAGVQHKNRVWDNPRMELKKLSGSMENGIAMVTAAYELPEVSACLQLEYRINNTGEMLVTERLITTADAKVPDLQRFGMRLEMPASFNRINYYGRGPWENYSDRKTSAFLGLYSQTVDEQFYPYIRPQETGTKSDVRWWHQGDCSGRGLTFISAEPFSVSALHYSQESLDEGLTKKQGHSQEVIPQDRVFLCMDKAQSGLACVNSWGARPETAYRLPYKDYTFEFRITPEVKLH